MEIVRLGNEYSIEKEEVNKVVSDSIRIILRINESICLMLDLSVFF